MKLTSHLTHTTMHECVRAYVCTCVRVCACLRAKHVCVRTRARAYVRASVRERKFHFSEID